MSETHSRPCGGRGGEVAVSTHLSTTLHITMPRRSQNILATITTLLSIAGCASRQTSVTGRGDIYLNVGVEGTLSFDDKDEIIECVMAVSKEPVLRIEVQAHGEVEVDTGVVLGPLDGGGDTYLLQKKGRHWHIVDDGKIRGWVSSLTFPGSPLHSHVHHGVECAPDHGDDCSST